MGAACESSRNAPARNLDASKAPAPLQKAAKAAEDTVKKAAEGGPDAEALKKTVTDAAKKGQNGIVDAAKKGDVKKAVAAAKDTAKDAASAAKKTAEETADDGPTKLRASAKAFQPAQATQPDQEDEGTLDKKPKERARFIAEVKAKFRSIHTDGEPQMTKHEWMILLPEHGFSKEDAAKVFSQIDTNNSGKISLNEFDEFHISTNLRMILEEFRESHSDCHITSADFRQRCYERYVCPISRVKRLFRILDTDGSGKITFDELEAGLKDDKAVKLLLEQLPNERSSQEGKREKGENRTQKTNGQRMQRRKSHGRHTK